jgi:hypothetical protein
MRGPRDTEHSGSAHDQVELQAAETIGMPPRPSSGKSTSTDISAPAGNPTRVTLGQMRSEPG